MTVTQTKAQEALDFIFADIAEDGPGGCAAILKGGEVLATRAAGRANIARGVPFSAQTRCRIASLTKPMAAQTIADLVAQGAFALGDQIGKFLPGLPAAQWPITLRHLLSMQSGLREEFALVYLAQGDGAADDHDLQQRLALLGAQSTVNFTPGERTLYANTNYTLLQCAAEAVTGKPFEALVAAAVFEPAGMSTAAFSRRNVPHEAGMGLGYKLNDKSFEPFEYWAEATAAGAAVASLDDLIAWHRWTRADPAGDWRGIGAEIRHNDGTEAGYGLGLERKVLCGHRTIGHAGALRGWAADYVSLPDLDLAVVLVANRLDLNWYERSREALAIACDLEPDPAATPRLCGAAEPLIAWRGDYGCEDLGQTLSFSFAGKDLTYESRRMPPQPDGSFARRLGVEPFHFRLPTDVNGAPDWIDVAEGNVTGRYRRAGQDNLVPLEQRQGVYLCDDLPGRIAICEIEGRVLVHAGTDWPFATAYELRHVIGGLCRGYDLTTGAGVDLHLFWPDLAAGPDRLEVSMTRLVKLPYRRVADAEAARRAFRFRPGLPVAPGQP